MNYKIIDDIEYHLVEPTGAAYEALRMIELKTSFFTIGDKIKIIDEFGLGKEDMKSELNIKTYYEELVNVLFLEQSNAKFEKINLAEVNRAKTDFFASLNRS